MTYHYAKARSGWTAIAAVLALSATPAVAPEGSAPAVDEVGTAPASTTAAGEPAIDPLAPVPEATETNETPDPIESAAVEPEVAAKPAGRPLVARTTIPRASSRSKSPAQAVTKPIDSQVPETPLLPSPESLAVAEPVETPTSVTADQELAPGDALPIAGAGLGALALAGIGMAVRRRRRDDVDEELWMEEWPGEQFREPAPPSRPAQLHGAPIPAELPNASAAPAGKTSHFNATLPAGFDLSRFGRHVQAAYRGPTPGNPSQSLRKRLKIGRALDQRERLGGQAAQAATVAPMKKMPVIRQLGLVNRSFGQPKEQPAFQY